MNKIHFSSFNLKKEMTKLTENEIDFLSQFHDVSDLDCFHCFNLVGLPRIILFGNDNMVVIINELKQEKEGWFMGCSSLTYKPEEKDDVEEKINNIFIGHCDLSIEAELGDNIIEISRQVTLSSSLATFYWNGIDKISFSDRNHKLLTHMRRRDRIDPHWYLSKKSINSHIFKLIQ
jgi:hypothetical protein